MKLSHGVLVVAVLAARSTPAQAAPEQASEGTAAPAAPETPAPSWCQLVDHRGVEPGDATTAARLVCSEIVQAGAPSGSRFRVAFGTLGSLIILSVDREGDTPGSTADSRSMTLHGIEEVRIAAPRLADAIVHGGQLAETQTVDNLVAEEARTPQSRPGKIHFAMGLAGAFTPFQDGLGVAPALILDLHYGMSQIEIGGSFRFSAGSSGSESSTRGTLVAASVGARYFTSNKEISPYFGGGLAYSYFSITEPGGFDGNNSGLGAYGDAGIEILRTHHAHLALGVRFDAPFFVLNDKASSNGSVTTLGTPGVNPPSHPSSMYFAPVSLEARLTF